MRERASWLLLAGGLVLAGLTGLLVYSTLRQQPAPAPVVEEEERTDVVVARDDIRPLTILTSAMIETRSFRVSNVPEEAITDAADAIGRVTNGGIPAGVVITLKDLTGATEDDPLGTALALESGSVLVVFPAEDPLSQARVVQPGDRVDIQASLPAGEGNALITQMIVQNLQVLAVAGEAPTLLTFVVDHQTSLVLKHLRDSGAQVDFVIRSRADTERIRTDAVDLPYIVDNYGVTTAPGE